MSVGAPSVPSRDLAAATRSRRALSVRADVVALAALAFVAIALAAITWNKWGDLTLDTGYDLVAGARVSHAELPYLDFVYFYGPLGPLVLGAFFEVLGISVGTSLVLGLLLAVTVIGLTYAVARLIAPPLGAALCGVLAAAPAFSTSNVSYVQPHSLSAPIGMILCLATVLALVRAQDSGARRWLVAAGVGVGLAALTRPETLGAVALAAGGWLLIRLVVAPAGGRRPRVADLLVVVGVALVVAVAGYGAFFVAAIFHRSLTLDDLIHVNLFARGNLRDSVSVVLEQLQPWTVASFVTLAGKLALYAAGGAALLAAGVAYARGGRTRVLVVAAFAVVVAVFAALAVGRPDTLRYAMKLSFGWIPAGAVLAALYLAVQAWRTRRLDREDSVTLLVTLLVVGFSAGAYALFVPYPNPRFPQETAYAMPVVAMFLLLLHTRLVPRLAPASAAGVRALGVAWVALLAASCIALVVSDARLETFTVRGAHGTMTALPADGPVYQQVVDVIERETRPGQPILLAPQMTALYVLTGRRNPLGQVSLLPGSLENPAAERDAARVLDDADLQLVVTDRDPLVRYRSGAFGTGYARVFGAWLHRNFTLAVVLHGPATTDNTRTLDVWRRRTE